MFDNDPKAHQIKDWECVLSTNMIFEAEMLKNYLSDHEIPCNILSKKDSSYVVDSSNLSMIFVYVPTEFAAKAKEIMADLENQDSDTSDDD
jgi:hypothetical protein